MNTIYALVCCKNDSIFIMDIVHTICESMNVSELDGIYECV